MITVRLLADTLRLLTFFGGSLLLGVLLPEVVRKPRSRQRGYAIISLSLMSLSIVLRNILSLTLGEPFYWWTTVTYLLTLAAIVFGLRYAVSLRRNRR